MIARNGNAPCLHGPGCPHDLGPASPAPLRGFSHHGHSVTGGSFVRPLPPVRPEVPEDGPERRRAQVAAAAARYRARQRGAK